MEEAVAQTALAPLMKEPSQLLSFGKMLRSRLALRTGLAAGAPRETLVYAAAATEIIHSASLLHDDVIDGAYLRRNAPSFWVERGVSGAILLGDLLFFRALDIIGLTEQGRLAAPLIRACGEICACEAEQELVLRGQTLDVQQCVSIARRKTGPLFAFMGFVAGGQDLDLASALQESGYEIGTAYQLADDRLDTQHNEAEAGKTLGSDSARMKDTAAAAFPRNGMNLEAFVLDLCKGSTQRLSPWPDVQQAWQTYLDQDLQPVLSKHLTCAPANP